MAKSDYYKKICGISWQAFAGIWFIAISGFLLFAFYPIHVNDIKIDLGQRAINMTKGDLIGLVFLIYFLCKTHKGR